MQDFNLTFPDSCLPRGTKVNLSESKDTEKLFNTVAGMYHIAIRALRQLRSGNIGSFDSHATDCSCHLRAIRVGYISNMVFHSIDLRNAIDNVLQTLERKKGMLTQVGPDLTKWNGGKNDNDDAPIVKLIRELSQAEKEKSSGKSKSLEFPLSDVLEKLEAKVILKDDFTFIVKAYFMNIVHDYQEIPHDAVTCTDEFCDKKIKMESRVFKEVTKTKNLLTAMMPEGDVLGNFVQRNIYNKIKADLTNESVQFLLDQTKTLHLEEIHAGLANNARVVDGKIEVPDVFSLPGAFKVLSRMDEPLPVLFKVKKCLHAHTHQEDTPFDLIMYLVPNGDNFVSMPVPKPNPERRQAVVVVEGKRSGTSVMEERVTDYAQRLTRVFDLLELSELDGAQHKQYTSSANEEKPSSAIPNLSQEQKVYLDAMANRAKLVGCHNKNQTLFLFSHIYADTIDSQLEKEFPESIQQKVNGYNVLFPGLKSISQPLN